MTTSSWLADFAEGLTRLAFPAKCWVCGIAMAERQPLICPDCEHALFHDPFPTCPRCASSVGPHLDLADGCPSCRATAFHFRGVYRAAPYEGPLRDVILKMKHAPGAGLAEVVGQVWSAHLAARLQALKADAVVPIPLHWLRAFHRGYNQSQTLAEELAQKLRVPCWSHALRRVKATVPQSQMDPPTKRWDNVKNIFEASPRFPIEGKTLILVDDVMTTGATLSQAARVLKQRKAKEIWCAVLGHGK